jgi:hypothetical protein
MALRQKVWTERQCVNKLPLLTCLLVGLPSGQ